MHLDCSILILKSGENGSKRMKLMLRLECARVRLISCRESKGKH
jgi:hypothetical protein